jgi:phosphorylcholine metabolism protein LicD
MPLRHHWDYLRRQGRVLVRHVRYADAAWSESGRRARAAALATLFRTVNAWLRESGAEHWICYGTLLGWWREQRILAHDRDVDFAAPVGAYAQLKAAAGRLPPGFTLHDTSHRHGGPKLYINYRGWEADIYFLVEENGRLRTILHSPNPGDTAPFPREWFYPARTVNFCGAPTQVPAQPESYLAHTYGYTGPDAELDPVTRYYRPARRRE